MKQQQLTLSELTDYRRWQCYSRANPVLDYIIDHGLSFLVRGYLIRTPGRDSRLKVELQEGAGLDMVRERVAER